MNGLCEVLCWPVILDLMDLSCWVQNHKSAHISVTVLKHEAQIVGYSGGIRLCAYKDQDFSQSRPYCLELTCIFLLRTFTVVPIPKLIFLIHLSPL